MGKPIAHVAMRFGVTVDVIRYTVKPSYQKKGYNYEAARRRRTPTKDLTAQP
jgi:hypothetical protein